MMVIGGEDAEEDAAGWWHILDFGGRTAGESAIYILK